MYSSLCRRISPIAMGSGPRYLYAVMNDWARYHGATTSCSLIRLCEHILYDYRWSFFMASGNSITQLQTINHKWETL